MNTTTACDHRLHAIPTDAKHLITVRQIIDAVDTWAQFNLRTEHGLAINGNEIYWFDYAAVSYTHLTLPTKRIV